MNRQEFIDALRQRLFEEGFPVEYVDTQCAMLTEKLYSLSDETVDQYTTNQNLDIIVRKLISQDSIQIEAAPTEVETESESVPEPAAVTVDSTSNADVQFVTADTLPVKKHQAHRPSATMTAEYTPCDRPRLLTFLLALICAPTIILLLSAAFGIFATVFMALAASIFFIVVAIIAIVGAGSLISVTALLYGATQVLSAPRYVGFHELGIGLLTAGITMAAAILLYNVAIRLIPFIYLHMGKLLKLFSRKLVTLAKNAVKGCEQL